ncbi:MAG: hypothetical protein OK454_06400, partial [Thaumarchaeota archaeon]|nr:hypothetical protein [Nitrososphaerota archaeon]
MACYPHNPPRRDVASKTRLIHLTLTTPWPIEEANVIRLHGYSYRLDRDSGELFIGVDPEAQDVNLYAD